MTTPRPILLAREHDRGTLRRLHAAGTLERLRRGAYQAVRDDEAPAAVERRRALDRIRAVHQQLRAPHVFGHESAALVWGAPLWRVPARTHVWQAARASSRSAPDIARHRGLPSRWVELGALPVTDLTRTVVDCLTTMPPLDGLVIADSATGRGLQRSDALALLAERTKRNGRARARFVVDHADAGADSPWETWLRYVVLRAGLPRPRTQYPVRTRIGQTYLDLAWPEHGVLAEFDGRVKYVDGALGMDHDAERTLFDEKVREDAIAEATGIRPLRFVARHARDPDDVVRRLLSRFPREVRDAARTNPLLPPP